MKFLRAFLYFLATTLMYLGIPLLGWGLDDLDGFFSIASRGGYAASAGLFAAAVGIQAFSGTEGIRGGKGDESKLNRRESVVRVVMVFALYLALALIPGADRRSIGVIGENSALRGLGVVLSTLGYGLVFWSGLALGRQYSAEAAIQKDHKLITDGPYRWIRHPRYSGVLLLTTGLSLAFRSWIGLAAVPVVLGALLFRIFDEEAVLHKEFGNAWEAYCRKSARLLPGVW